MVEPMHIFDEQLCHQPPSGGGFFGSSALGGISDWGPFPSMMIARNSFRGPGAWTFDAAVSKIFPIHEQVNLEFHTEGFDLLNHHNLFIQQALNDVVNVGNGTPVPSLRPREVLATIMMRMTNGALASSP